MPSTSISSAWRKVSHSACSRSIATGAIGLCGFNGPGSYKAGFQSAPISGLSVTLAALVWLYVLHAAGNIVHQDRVARRGTPCPPIPGCAVTVVDRPIHLTIFKHFVILTAPSAAIHAQYPITSRLCRLTPSQQTI